MNTKENKMKIKLFLICFFISYFSIFSATYYVDNKNPKANDKNPGTNELPFLTISKGISVLSSGDTLIIKEGIYRETLYINKKGEKPIVIKSEENEKVIITGSEIISGWRKTNKEEVYGNENYEKIYVSEVKDEPKILTDGEKILNLSRIPEEGWWKPTSVEGNTVFYDEENLTQKDKNFWKNWTLCALFGAGGGITKHNEFDFDPDNHKITLKNPWSNYSKTIDIKRDKYYFSNHPLGIKKKGDYSYIRTENAYRIYIWPTKFDEKGNPYVEIVNKGNLIVPHQSENIILDGLEICFSKERGIGSSPCIVKNFTIKNCYIHDCDSYGINISGENIEIKNCIFRRNSHGIVIYKAKNINIEENDIGWNLIDGIDCAGEVRNLKIIKNYVHHHFSFGHPDSIQFWSDVDGIEIKDNVLVVSGQTLMSENISNIKVENNIIIGTSAMSLIILGKKAELVYGRKRSEKEEDKKRWEEWESLPNDNVEINHNTIIGTGFGPFNIVAKGVRILNNIIYPMHEYPVFYPIIHKPSFYADYNLVWIGTRTKQILSNLRNDKLEINGSGEIPQFENAPFFFSIGWTENSKNKIFLRESIENWETGDYIEINMDGVIRKIKEIGSNYIVIEPDLDKIPDFEIFVFNWKKNSNFKWDLKLKENSPGYKKAENGKNTGSDLNIQNYMKGDFNGDGKKDFSEKFKY